MDSTLRFQPDATTDADDIAEIIRAAGIMVEDDNDSSDNDEESIYAMLDVCPPPVAAWTKDGTAFVILDPKELEATYLPQFFKSAKFTSFYRQLNSYRFNKTRVGTALEFSHPDFVHGQPERINLINRRCRVRKLNARSIESMTSSQVRSTLADVVSFIRVLHADLQETKAFVETIKNPVHKP
ncbi:unnamed protein product [Aphanomyces euteiches]|nr:hypothetical protein AeRB84_001044 [Aphanomyces euteiches]